MTIENVDSKIIVALDDMSKNAAIQLVQTLDPSKCRLKVGMELFSAYGLTIVDDLKVLKFDIFLDLKFKDIPNTVAKAAKAAAELGVWMFNVHCDGGLEMMKAAADAVKDFDNPPLITGVTVLTSMNQNDLSSLSISNSVETQVLQLANLAVDAGLDGVVCSGKEAPLLKSEFQDRLLLVTPGIRLSSDSADDQKRVLTPDQAVKSGSDYLVIGRPITKAKVPLDAFHKCLDLSKIGSKKCLKRFLPRWRNFFCHTNTIGTCDFTTFECENKS